MTQLFRRFSFLVVLSVAGCSCSSEVGVDDLDGGGDPTDDAGRAMDARVRDASREDARTSDARQADGEVPEDGEVPADGEVVDGSTVGCAPAPCAGRVYACGDCDDDDGDGLVDSADPGCIGACDDTEDLYDVDLSDTPTCMRDCYFDDDQGPGNDGCRHDSRCDPLGPDAPDCPYDPEGGGVTCEDSQPTQCQEVCAPIVPNGCDCFGCCELPAGSGAYVFLGGVDPDGHRSCSPETVDDPEICRPCTPHGDCLNECERCEICIGKPTIPDDCIAPTPDAGVPADGSVPRDGSVPADGGVDPRCPRGGQPCGLPSDPQCPDSEFCLTGCCQYFG